METSHVSLLPGLCAVRQLVLPWLAKVCVLKHGGASKASRACVAQWQSICLVNRRSPVQSRAEASVFQPASVLVCVSRPHTRARLLLLLICVNERVMEHLESHYSVQASFSTDTSWRPSLLRCKPISFWTQDERFRSG